MTSGKAVHVTDCVALATMRSTSMEAAAQLESPAWVAFNRTVPAPVGIKRPFSNFAGPLSRLRVTGSPLSELPAIATPSPKCTSPSPPLTAKVCGFRTFTRIGKPTTDWLKSGLNATGHTVADSVRLS